VAPIIDEDLLEAVRALTIRGRRRTPKGSWKEDSLDSSLSKSLGFGHAVFGAPDGAENQHRKAKTGIQLPRRQFIERRKNGDAGPQESSQLGQKSRMDKRKEKCFISATTELHGGNRKASERGGTSVSKKSAISMGRGGKNNRSWRTAGVASDGIGDSWV